jgi:hypothetical protein
MRVDPIETSTDSRLERGQVGHWGNRERASSEGIENPHRVVLGVSTRVRVSKHLTNSRLERGQVGEPGERERRMYREPPTTHAWGEHEGEGVIFEIPYRLAFEARVGGRDWDERIEVSMLHER